MKSVVFYLMLIFLFQIPPKVVFSQPVDNVKSNIKNELANQEAKGNSSKSKKITDFQKGIYIYYVGPNDFPTAFTIVSFRKYSDAEIKEKFFKESLLTQQFVIPEGELDKIASSIKGLMPKQEIKWNEHKKNIRFQIVVEDEQGELKRVLPDKVMNEVFLTLEKFSKHKYPDLFKWIQNLKKIP